MMAGNARFNCRIKSVLKTRTSKSRTIVVGLKSDFCSREVLFQILRMIVRKGDTVFAVHVQQTDDSFDPNTFHIHEDLCKSKKVDLLVKVCSGNSYISELSHQVRINYATILAIGCDISGPNDSVVDSCLKVLPPTCSLLVMDNAGRIIIEKQGTSQQGSAGLPCQTVPSHQAMGSRLLHKSLTVPSSSVVPNVLPEHRFNKSLTMPPTSAPSSSGFWQCCTKRQNFQPGLPSYSQHNQIDRSTPSLSRHMSQAVASSSESPDIGPKCRLKNGSAGLPFETALPSSLQHNQIDQSIACRPLHKSLTRPSSSVSPNIVPEHRFRKSLTMPPNSSISSSRAGQFSRTGQYFPWNDVQLNCFSSGRWLQRLACIEAEKVAQCFTAQELLVATNNFSSQLVIGGGRNCKIYQANLKDGQAVAVKVLKETRWSADELLSEVETLCRLRHENIVQIVGYCASDNLQAIVFDLLKGSLKQHLRKLKWVETMTVANGVAKALEYLHHDCDPPIIHRDLKPSNILLSSNLQPKLSDFRAGLLRLRAHQVPADYTNPTNISERFGYLAPEYLIYGKVDEKIDVYSFGVVLLELITGKEAVQMNQVNHESLVLWARSLLLCDEYEGLVDIRFNNEYKKEEMEIMTFIASLCLMHSPARRPTMKMITRLFEDSEYWVEMQPKKDELLNGFE